MLIAYVRMYYVSFEYELNTQCAHTSRGLLSAAALLPCGFDPQ